MQDGQNVKITLLKVILNDTVFLVTLYLTGSMVVSAWFLHRDSSGIRTFYTGINGIRNFTSYTGFPDCFLTVFQCTGIKGVPV